MAKYKRPQYIIGVDPTKTGDSTSVWEILGKDNDELSKELNNEVEETKNVLGETEVDITAGNRTMTVDPYKMRDDYDFADELYDILKYDKDGSDVEYPFIEINTFKKVGESQNEYDAWVQKGAVDLKSYGGNTKAIGAPFDIHFIGEKTYGSFNPTTKKFTPSTNDNTD